MKGLSRLRVWSARLTGWAYAAVFVLAAGAVTSLVWENEILPM